MQERKTKILRVATVPLSLKIFCKELLCEMNDEYDVLAVSSSGTELDEIADAGINTTVVEMRREISLFHDFVSLLRLIKLFIRQKPDIVHSITPKAGLLSMIAARIARVPIRVHSFTGLVFPTATGMKQKVLMLTDRTTCAMATHVLPEGDGVKNDLLNYKITDKRLNVLGYGNVRGIDVNYYDRTPDVMDNAAALIEKFGIDPNRDYIYVFIGRIVHDKGINELAEAFKRLHAKAPHTHLVIAGEEEPSDPISEAARQIIRSHPNIHLSEGWIDDVRPFYAMASALVFPSYREGMPNVVIEAGAMGLPSIVTDINGSREIITHGFNGLIVPPADTESLYYAMHRLAVDEEYTKKLAAPARDYITARYEASFVRACYKDFYKEILK